MHRGQDLFRVNVGMRAAAAVVFLLLSGFVVLRGAEGSGEPWLRSDKLAERGTEILLPCVLKSPQCEGLHSIKWYRGPTRIFIFSEDAGIIRGNNDIAARADIEYSSNSSKTYLKIPEVQLEDEGLYKCEATYLAVNRECNNVQHIILNVTVQPGFIRVIDKKSKNTLSSGSTLGPINEGSMISLYCESGEGKPVPTVEWFKDDQPLEATSLSTITDTGIGTSSSLLEMQITREELGATFTCKVNNIALVEPLTVDIKPDIHVRPLRMDLEGVVGHVVQGTKILLQCKVQAARPAANVTWKNGTHLLNKNNERFEMFETKIQENEDGTFDTISYLAFTATVYDNSRTFKCYAGNSVTDTEDLRQMKEATTIEVLYPPIVTMKPNNMTVNETDDFIIFCDYEANPATLIKVTWLRDDDELVLNEEHYDGGITEQTALTVKNATPSDMGSYKCILENNAGATVSDDAVQVSVFYKPVVEVIMDPETPVNEADRQNVSLTCEVDAGNPAILTAVRWYLDGDLLKELPDCSRNSTAMTASSEESSAFCDIDPSKLLLESVGRTFHGNYSCEGKNEAGWGPISPSTPVIVYYKPGPASITYEPRQVVKKQALSITCFVLDPGRPRVSGFKWLRGWHRLPDENEATLYIESVNLETEANFTCLAYNEAGDGEPATTFIDVSAAPTFIKKLHSYRGYVYNSPNVSIMCWVECAPICSISWLRDDIPMDFTKTNRYYVSNVYHPPDPRTNDFESIQSTLVWNLTVWPNGQLDRAEDNVKFTCKSSSNGIGAGVESSTHFHVEFPPEEITISKKIINVTENTIPESVECNAKARPKPNFRWFREGYAETSMEGHVLDLKVPIPRRSSGIYYCEAKNRHGSLNISMIMNVQFKPECTIEKVRFEGQDYVVCSADANPKETGFTWSLKNENDTLEQVAEIRNGKSYMPLDTSVTNFRTYMCVANNTIGHSVACERDIPAHHGTKSHIPWWHQLDGNLLLIIIVVAVVMILVLILICVAIYIVCRRKRSQMKYTTRVVHLEEREHPDGGPPSPTVSSHSVQSPAQPTPAPRWPLKPGVLVHINRTHSLRSGLSVRANEANLRNEPVGKRNDEPLKQRFLDETSLSSTGRNPTRTVFRRGRKDQAAQRTASMTSLNEDGMLARANKIKAMFGVQLKEQATLPGISREKTDPNQAANNNHVNSVSEVLPDSGTKTFYENLPFHGIQAPPNKLVTPKFARVSALHGTLHSITTSPCSSRPPSRAVSLCDGSSGYESTMSHLGPHYNIYNVPRSNSPVLKYNTLKPRRRKQKHSQQFYSLRLCRRHENIRRKYELYAIPIYKTCPHRSDSTTTIATIVRSLEDAPSLTLSQASASISLMSRSAPSTPIPSSPTTTTTPPPPPIPAPRMSKKTDPSKHTYQNVPPPVFPPKNASLPKLKTDSLYNYKEHYQQQHRQEMQQYSYPLPSNSSNQLTLPLTRSLYHSSTVSPLQTSLVHTNNSRPSTLMHHETATTGNHLPAVHRNEEQQQQQQQQQQQEPNYGNQDARQSSTRRHATNRRNERNRKYRKHERTSSDRSKSKQNRQRDRDTPSRRSNASFVDTPDCETSFHQIPDLGVPETMYKISYPHYYEDDIAECSADYHRPNSAMTRQQQQQQQQQQLQPPWEHQSNRCTSNNTPQFTADTGDAKNRSKTSKTRLGDTRSIPSAPTIMQYAEFHFRDVGQEIDV
ncbi:hemicentin-1 isoform X3 [Solenopsis invicta]|uniref:hemicentin-1 isoform X3 n=1 Tax=Solenopsis invicta TaxID=13686 RepID=UPI00193EA0A1|nr:hemicentin-1 isoform X3 [Solenopsis invicta]